MQSCPLGMFLDGGTCVAPKSKAMQKFVQLARPKNPDGDLVVAATQNP